jgi:ABC-2 type transport system ATP-binding protein
VEVSVRNLKQYFGKTRAVDDITFTFWSGQVVGFVGPNGAGKTTTMRIMATIDDPTDGDVFFDGVSIVQYPEKAQRVVGFMPDFLPTHKDMTVDDYLDFYARAYSIRNNERRKVVDGIEVFTGLRGIRDKFIKALSKGMKQRVSLARALIHDPEVLILDEPAAGLDPRARIELRELISALGQQGKALLVSSHILAELAEICDSAVIIEKGRILRAGTLDQIKTAKSHFTMLLRAAGDNKALHKEVLQLPKIRDARALPNGVEVDVEAEEEYCGTIITELISRGHRVIEMRHLKDDLEDIFMDVTKGELS